MCECVCVCVCGGVSVCVGKCVCVWVSVSFIHENVCAGQKKVRNCLLTIFMFSHNFRFEIAISKDSFKSERFLFLTLFFEKVQT